jgi:hypothetical protein
VLIVASRKNVSCYCSNEHMRSPGQKQEKIGSSKVDFRLYIGLFGKDFYHRGTEDTEKAGAEEEEEVER